MQVTTDDVAERKRLHGVRPANALVKFGAIHTNRVRVPIKADRHLQIGTLGRPANAQASIRRLMLEHANFKIPVASRCGVCGAHRAVSLLTGERHAVRRETQLRCAMHAR